jgi:penicillin amidase
MQQDPITVAALEAYAKGVNDYIKKLRPRDYPFEYKVLDYAPEEWSPVKSVLLIKFMAFHLSGYSRDLALTRSRLRLNEIDFKELFPVDSQAKEPIIPADHPWNFKSRAPSAPSSEFQASLEMIQPTLAPHPDNGSNNWAVGPLKSSTGFPIVANDVHLEYSLPSLWYQVQLTSPQQNVMGASLPGAPGVVIGFNNKVAWAVTNGGADVMDWYELRFRDGNQREYLHDGQWRPVISQEQKLLVRGEEAQTLILRRTHYGPIPYTLKEQPFLNYVPKGVALRWAALDPSNELRSFLQLNHAQNYKECREALAEYGSPGQNFICADNQGDFGLTQAGHVPIRWTGQGRMIADGTDSNYDWRGWIPFDELPTVTNPARGFVSSANQKPTGPSYPHYLGWRFAEDYRGTRINQLLRSQAKISPEQIKEMQKDTLSLPAQAVLPTLLKLVPQKNLRPIEVEMLKILKSWDYKCTADSQGATLFNIWWQQLTSQIWSDKFPDPVQFQYPSLEKTIDLILRDPHSKWFDRRDTEVVETLPDLLQKSLRLSSDEIQKRWGFHPQKWLWSTYQPTTLKHLARLPGFSLENLKVAGQAQALFANTGTHGPDWKMVVALGPQPRAWFIYPGGQAGDPTSRYYQTFVSEWATSSLREMNFYTESSHPHVVYSLEMVQ